MNVVTIKGNRAPWLRSFFALLCTFFFISFADRAVYASNLSLLVDNFDLGATMGSYLKRTTSLGRALEREDLYHGTWSKRPNYSIISKNKRLRMGDHGSCLEVEYDTSSKGNAGYYTLLGGLDASAYNALSFWVRGQEGGETFDIGFSSQYMTVNSFDALYVGPVEMYLEGGPDKEWQEVIVPLCRVTMASEGRVSLDEIGALQFRMGDKQKGNLYFENIRFVHLSEVPNGDLCDQ